MSDHEGNYAVIRRSLKSSNKKLYKLLFFYVNHSMIAYPMIPLGWHTPPSAFFTKEYICLRIFHVLLIFITELNDEANALSHVKERREHFEFLNVVQVEDHKKVSSQLWSYIYAIKLLSSYMKNVANQLLHFVHHIEIKCYQAWLDSNRSKLSWELEFWDHRFPQEWLSFQKVGGIFLCSL